MPDERPIVERPDWLFDPDYQHFDGINPPGLIQLRAYIEHLEGQLTFDQERNMDLHKCQATNRTLKHDLEVTEKALSDAHTRLEAIYESHGPNVEFNPEKFLCGWWCADYPCQWNCKGEQCSRPTGPDPIWDY